MTWKKMKPLTHYVDGREYLLLFKSLEGTVTTRAAPARPVVATFRNRPGKARVHCWDTGHAVYWRMADFAGFIEIPGYKPWPDQTAAAPSPSLGIAAGAA